MKKLLILITAIVGLASCSENYSNGERIGTVTQFSEKGLIWKSHEGHLNVTQTGMNSSTGFDFSVDNDNEPVGLVAKLDSAANFGWKVKLIYHETSGFNWLKNRGETDHFIKEVVVLDKNFDNPFNKNTNGVSGKVVDTIYVVIMNGEQYIKKELK